MHHWRIAHIVCCCLATLLVCFTPASSIAADKDVAIDGAGLGLDGKYKVGFWTPVRITLTGGEKEVLGRLELTTADGDGLPSRYTDPAGEYFKVPASQSVTLLRYIKIGRVGAALTISLRDVAGKEIARRTFSADRLTPALSATRELIVTVGRSAGVENAISMLDKQAGIQESEKEELGAVAGRVEKAADLPDRWWGYEGVDALILTTRKTDVLDEMTPQQYEALLNWVRMGGRLVVSVGYRGKELFGQADSRFAKLAPGKFEHVYGRDDIDMLEETKGLEAVANTSQPLAALHLTLLIDVPVQYVEAYEGSGPGDIPTIIRRPFGFGQIVVVTLDLDEPPVADWPGRSRLVAKIIHPGAAAKEYEGEQGVTHLGYQDLAGQMRSALDRFRGVTLVAFSWITGLIVLYILLIGPVDYLLLRRYFRHMQWTWITFPTLVVAFCVLAFVLAGVWRTRQLHINQVDLVDIDFSQQESADGETSSVFLRGTTWANLYSPRNESYDLSLQANVPGDVKKIGLLLTWQGLPGKSLGGMQSRTNTVSGHSPGYAIDADPSLDKGRPALTGMPIPVSATKTLVARWWSHTRIESPGSLSSFSRGAGRMEEIQGRITNPLDVELRDCVLFYGNLVWVYSGKTLGPGESFDVQSDARMKLRAWRLNHHRVVDSQDVQDPWDTASHDVPRIVEMMMFHEAARGRTYTHLTHRYQAYTDLSDHLRMGRAILVGRAKTSIAHLQRKGRDLKENYDQHWTFYRLVLPVESSDSR